MVIPAEVGIYYQLCSRSLSRIWTSPASLFCIML